MPNVILYPISEFSSGKAYIPSESITITNIDNPYNFTINVSKGDVVEAGTEIRLSSKFSLKKAEIINGVQQIPQAIITYA